MGAERLPCGCVLDTVGETFVVEPCSTGCEYFQFVLAESKKRGNTIDMLSDPETPPELEDQVRAMLRGYGGDGG